MSDNTDTPPAAEPVVDPLDDFIAGLHSDAPAAEAPAAEAPEAPAAEAPESPAAEAPESPEAPEKPDPEPEAETDPEPESEEDDPLKLDEKDDPEKPTEEEEEIPEAPKDRTDWDKLRSSRDRYKEEASAIKAEIEAVRKEAEELRAKAARAAELEAREKEFEEHEKELALTRLEATKEYKETIMAPLDAIGAAARVLAEANEADPDKVLDVLSESDPVKQRVALKELTAGWDTMDSNELLQMTKDAKVLFDKQDTMREHAAAATKEQQALAAQREAEEKANYAKQYEEGTKNVIEALKEKTPFIPLIEGETVEDRFNSLASKVAATDFDSQSPRAKAFAAAAALMHPNMVKTIAKLQEENATLHSRIKDQSSSSPSVTPQNDSNAETEEEDFLKSMGVSTNNILNVVGE